MCHLHGKFGLAYGKKRKFILQHCSMVTDLLIVFVPTIIIINYNLKE